MTEQQFVLPEWEISFEEYLGRVGANRDEFSRNLRLPDVARVQKVLPLRDMAKIQSLIPLRYKLLATLIKNITTLDGQKPFANARIQLLKVDPNHCNIGQRFVYRENYVKLLEELGHLFKKFVVAPGIVELGAYMAFGIDRSDAYAMAYYIPPIIEKHDGQIVIMDGIHRNFIAKQIGSPINAIVVENVAIPFPCSLHSWNEIEVISLAQKPKDINLRYFDLQQQLFRDLKYLGIDG